MKAPASKNNQKIGLLVALIDIRCWKKAQGLLAILNRAKANPTRDAAVVKSLCGLAHYLLEPVYKKLATRKYVDENHIIFSVPVGSEICVLEYTLEK